MVTGSAEPVTNADPNPEVVYGPPSDFGMEEGDEEDDGGDLMVTKDPRDEWKAIPLVYGPPPNHPKE